MQQVNEIPKLPARPADSHKGMFGRILIAGGSVGFSGAPALAAMAALRSGAGLVRVAVPGSILPIVASIDPCYTTLPLPETGEGQMESAAGSVLIRMAEEYNIFCFGPGAGTGTGVRETLFALLAVPDLRMLVDADGLNVLAKTSDWPRRRKASLILTPHPGELKRLWRSLFREPVPERRTDQAERLAEQTGCTIVLKGFETIVAGEGKIYKNPTGNPGMSTGGSGDVLSGMIAALMGQGLGNFDAAVLGVYVHGRAGDLGVGEKGQISLIASDLLDFLPEAFKSH